MKKLLSALLLFLGCSKAGPELHILNWGEYFADDTIAKFEKESGCRVIYDKFDSPEALRAKLDHTPSGYDVVFPSDELVPSLAAGGKLEKLDLSKLPNFKNIAAAFKGLGYDAKNEWSVPYMWSTTGIAYNRERVKPAPDSWAAIFDAKIQDHLSILEDPREVFAAALRLDGCDLAALTPEMIDKAKARLLGVKPKLVNGQPQDAMRKADVWIAQMYGGDAAQVGESVGYVIPKEGGTFWVDNICIAKGSTRIDLAHKFIDFLMRADVAAANSNYKKYPSPNEAAKPMINKAILENPTIYPPADVLARCKLLGEMKPELKKRLMDAWGEFNAK